MKTKSFGQKLNDLFLGLMNIIIPIASYFFPFVLIYFNHWIGLYARLIFIIILAIEFYLITRLIKNICDGYSPFYKDSYTYLGKYLLLAGLIFGLAGLTIHIKWPGDSTSNIIYNVKSGSITLYDNQIRWYNPFSQTTVLMNDLRKKYDCESILFEKPLLISFKQAQIKIGVSRNELINSDIIGPNGTLLYNEEITKSIERAKEKTLLKMIDGIKNHGLTHDQKLIFISMFKDEIKENLPAYLETGEILIEQ